MSIRLLHDHIPLMTHNGSLAKCVIDHNGWLGVGSSAFRAAFHQTPQHHEPVAFRIVHAACLSELLLIGNKATLSQRGWRVGITGVCRQGEP